MKDFHSSERTNLFWLYSFSFLYDGAEYTELNNSEIDRVYRLGSGIGFDFDIIKHLTISLNATLQFTYNCRSVFENNQYSSYLHSNKSLYQELKYFSIGYGFSVFYCF